MMNPTYTVSVWDMDEQAWVPEFEHVSKWGLRPALRALYGFGYSNLSVAVNRDDSEHDGGRWRGW